MNNSFDKNFKSNEKIKKEDKKNNKITNFFKVRYDNKDYENVEDIKKEDTLICSKKINLNEKNEYENNSENILKKKSNNEDNEKFNPMQTVDILSQELLENVKEKKETPKRGRKRKNINEINKVNDKFKTNETIKINETIDINEKTKIIETIENNNVKTNEENIKKIEENKINETIDNNNIKTNVKRKISLIGLLGTDINITVNVNDIENEDSESDTNSSDSSFKFVNKKNMKRNTFTSINKKDRKRIKTNLKYNEDTINILDKENEIVSKNNVENILTKNNKKKIDDYFIESQSLYKKKSFSDNEDYDFTYKTKLNDIKEETIVNSLQKNKINSNLLNIDKLKIANEKNIKSDNEFNDLSLKKKATRKIRNSCLGISTEKQNKIKKHRNSCIDLENINNHKYIKNNFNLTTNVLTTSKNEKTKKYENNDNTKEIKKDDKSNIFNTTIYKLEHTEEEFNNIIKDFKRNENMNDIINENKKIKVLRVLNKYYFDKEYNNYNNYNYLQKKRKKKKNIQLLKDKGNKPYTFYIAGNFIFFNNFVLVHKLKNIGYNITHNFRRCNCLILGNNLSCELLNRIKNFEGIIFDEKAIILHIKKRIEKFYKNFNPINLKNGKKYKMNYNISSLKNMDSFLLNKRLKKICKYIESLIKNIKKDNEQNLNINCENLFILKKNIYFFLSFLQITKKKYSPDIDMLLNYCKNIYIILINTYIFLIENIDKNINNNINKNELNVIENVEYILHTKNVLNILHFFKDIFDIFSNCDIYEQNLIWNHDLFLKCIEIYKKEKINENNLIINDDKKEKNDIYITNIKEENCKNIVNSEILIEKNKDENINENEGYICNELKNILLKKNILREEKLLIDENIFDEYIIFDYFSSFDNSDIDITDNCKENEINENNEINEIKEKNENFLNAHNILKNMKKKEKIKQIDNLWSVYFQPNSLYEIAGHKNEIISLYKIMKKIFADTIENLKYESDEEKKKDEKIELKNETIKEYKENKKNKNKLKKTKNEEDIINEKIIFLIYPPNVGIKRLVELTCYACDLYPIYENKVQKYKNINYYFKYTHGLKAISIYNANKLDKNAMNELNTRNDISICLYEDKNYIINKFNKINLPLLDNINHILIKFNYPSKKSLFYRSFVVSSCVIKNLEKKVFRLLFETCKLRSTDYCIENVYSKLHLISLYINNYKNVEKEIDKIIEQKNEQHILLFPNNIIYEYIIKHILNPFLMNNYDAVLSYIRSTKYLKAEEFNKKRDLMKLNEYYYFYGGFDIDEIKNLIYDHFDKLHARNKKIIIDFSIHKMNVLDDEKNIDYLYVSNKHNKKRENILINILDLFLYSSILIKINDLNVSSFAIDLAVYWKTYLYMNPIFRKKQNKKKIYHNEETKNLTINRHVNEIKLQDYTKNKIDRSYKQYSEKIKKYKNLMLHLKIPFNFTSSDLVYDILQSNKFVNFNIKKK